MLVSSLQEYVLIKTVILPTKATTKPKPATNKSKTTIKNITQNENQPTIKQMPWLILQSQTKL